MRSTLAVFLFAVAVPKSGVRGCAEAPEPGPTTIRVEGLADGRDIGLACHATPEIARSYRSPYLPQEGSTLTVDAPCQLYAYRRDGALIRRSRAVHVLPGDERAVIDLPTDPSAGLGISFDPEPEGVRVTHVIPLSPAEGKLRKGELIVAVDGRATLGQEIWDFWELSLGAEGTSVVIEVDGPPGGRRTVELVRASIGIDDPLEGDRLRAEVDLRARKLSACLPSWEKRPGFDLTIAFSVRTNGLVWNEHVSATAHVGPAELDCILRRVGSWIFTPRSEDARVDRVVRFRPE